ncbi:large ribosomal subunit protein eL29-like [Meriones unguiculatus]|uniref:large ribosomal subunit protein eL29-like n=1 Tax=Meriones unguiculatus TaxID=10047 RepID=UPI00293E1D42|nr:large ribosomal subunit protein eL29-like [Meriones unguiculatus]
MRALIEKFAQMLREPRDTVQTWPSPRTTPHTTSPTNGTEMAWRNPGHKNTNLLRKGVDPKFLRNMRFAKKYNKKGLKKMQANSAEAVSARAGAIKAPVKPAEVKPKTLKGPRRKFSHLAFIAVLQSGKKIRSYVAKGRRLYQPKPKVQSQAEAAAPAEAQASLRLRLSKVRRLL